MYICVLALVLTLTGFSYLKKEYAASIYVVTLCLLTLFLALRFGQGSDYWGYRNLFERMPAVFDFNADVYNTDKFHGEIGWKLMMNLFKYLGMNFETVIVLLAFAEMSLIAWALERYCGEHKMLGLLILFPTVYLTYFFSTLRQGFVIPINLSVLLPLLQKKRYIPYAAVTLLLCLIHRSSLLLLLPLLLIKMSRRTFHGLLAASGLGGVLLCVTPAWDHIHQFVCYIYPALGDEMVVEINFLALGERFATGGLIFLLFFSLCRDGAVSDEAEILYKTYMLANMFYFILMGSQTLAGRFSMIFKCVEVILLPMLLGMYMERRPMRAGRTGICVYAYCLMLTSALTLYHLGFCSEEGNYYEYHNAFEYPYISIFQKDRVYELFDTEYFD